MADKTMEVKIIDPERTFYEGQVSFIEFNTTEGMIGIYPKHIPTTVVIAPGVLKIVEETGTEKEAALHSGFAEILGEKITILAECVEWPEEIDTHRAKEAQVRAERRIKDSSQDTNRAELALKRSVVRLTLGQK
ncbi:MAG: ATP synthase F1 subunit epsilon [Clostridium sp.]|nr:ATP synthase F1 subunit epsilon [Clostridium sp.]MCM1400300.1 ATP synthase F1 subunit epsilon [Clostridium sp.]MCM1461021.1 ATP synthase F1 subunit epsilon [Bacteroides sp.]